MKPATFTPDQIADHYAAAHERVVELVRSLSPEQVATPVPATPGWDVHDVLAHLAANPTDGLAGRITGIPSDEFTAGQVEERKDASVEDLVTEWQSTVPTMVDGARAGLVPPNLAVDALTHEQDIRGAVGAGRVPDAEGIRLSVGLYLLGVMHRLSTDGAPALRIVATDADLDVVAGEGAPAATLRASAYDLFRTMSGRRGRDGVLALEWDGDATAYLPYLNIFGTVPDYALVD